MHFGADLTLSTVAVCGLTPIPRECAMIGRCWTIASPISAHSHLGSETAFLSIMFWGYVRPSRAEALRIIRLLLR